MLLLMLLQVVFHVNSMYDVYVTSKYVAVCNFENLYILSP